MSACKIPKIIHQLWVGPNPIPTHCHDFIHKMKIVNPNYEHKVWGNEVLELYKDDEFLKEYLKNPDLYKWAFICDRIRLLLLRDFGGIYCDVDCNPIKSFDTILGQLNEEHTFVSGVKPSQDNNTLLDCTMYASTRNSRGLGLCLSTYTNTKWANGCRMFSDALIAGMGPDIALFGYQYFYDNTITDKTVLLHDIEDTRLFSWTAGKKLNN